MKKIYVREVQVDAASNGVIFLGECSDAFNTGIRYDGSLLKKIPEQVNPCIQAYLWIRDQRDKELCVCRIHNLLGPRQRGWWLRFFPKSQAPHLEKGARSAHSRKHNSPLGSLDRRSAWHTLLLFIKISNKHNILVII